MRYLQNRHRPPASPIEVQEHLGDIQYPQDKQSLLARVRRRGAPVEVRDTLQQLPNRIYEDPAELENALELLE